MQKESFGAYTITTSDEDRDTSKCLWDASKHWKVIVKRKDSRRNQISFNFYGGSMAKCTPIEAFWSYISDAMAIVNNGSIEEFADEYGYDIYEDRVRVKRLYTACMNAYYKCRRFIGSDDDIIELYNELDNRING